MSGGDPFGSTVDVQALSADAGPQLMILGPDGARTQPVPDRGQLSVGRHVDNDLCLDDPSVSRRHAVLHFEGEAAFVEDLGGANGTSVSGQTLDPAARVALAAGAPVQIGATVLVLRRGGARAAPARPDLVRSPKMLALYEQVARIARGRLSVLVLGETGVGKEVLARAVHERSPRAGGPFLALNCGALSVPLLESELFGYVSGAFTGAERDKPGLLEAADGGTVFLDEVGELPPPVQVKLLRALEQREVTRLGAVEARPVDVRFVAATNRDLEAEAARGGFRKDLFYRLAGASLPIPPLRERSEEIVGFAEHFAAEAAEDAGLPSAVFSAAAQARLRAYPWPGNLRELKNAVTRAVLLSADGHVEPTDLPGDAAPAAGSPRPATEQSLTEAQRDERARIVAALETHAGNQTRAAAALGISRQTLSKKLDRYQLPRPRK